MSAPKRSPKRPTAPATRVPPADRRIQSPPAAAAGSRRASQDALPEEIPGEFPRDVVEQRAEKVAAARRERRLTDEAGRLVDLTPPPGAEERARLRADLVARMAAWTRAERDAYANRARAALGLRVFPPLPA